MSAERTARRVQARQACKAESAPQAARVARRSVAVSAARGGAPQQAVMRYSKGAVLKAQR